MVSVSLTVFVLKGWNNNVRSSHQILKTCWGNRLMRKNNFQLCSSKQEQIKERASHEYLCVSGCSARQLKHVRDVGEADVDWQNGDVEVQQHGSLQAGVVGVVHLVVQLQGAILGHVEVPL